MRIFRNFDDARGIISPVVTTGSFDGVHIGHKAIINRLRSMAAKHGGESVLITFHPHPRKVLYPESAGKDLRLINSQEEKMYLLEKSGLDNVIIIEFTREFSRITSEEFVRDFLHDKLKAKVVVAGFNHHFGFNQEGDYRQLWNMREKYNFEAEEIPEQEVQHETVSSTRIRKAISEGYIQRANAYLDHYYIIMGVAELPASPFSWSVPVFYRIAVTDENKLLPSDGVYAVSVDTGGEIMKGMVLIYTGRPGMREVLVNLPADKRNIAGLKCILLFQKKITGPLSEDNPELAAQKLDKAVKEILELIY